MSVQGVMTDVSVRLGSVQALDGVSFSVAPGQFLALLGPSGSGKTTTLNVLAGFVRPDRGSVTFDEKDMTSVPTNQRDLGIVFQSYALFPHMSVADNVAFPLRMRGTSRADRATRVREALELVDLGGHAARSVATLSGGQRQRVALARAVVFEPRMLLLDEPLAALDKQLRDSMQLELKRLQQRLGITTVAVTHDQVEALSMADLVAVMRDGRIEQIASPSELYLRPATLFVATFLGEANLVPVEQGMLAAFGPLPGGPRSGQAVIRPEHLTLGADPDDQLLGADAVVDELTFQGPRLRVRVRLRSRPDVALTLAESTEPTGHPLAVGQEVRVRVRAANVHVIEQPVPADGAPAPC
jgi:putative spermidine/putrescine transport system ATP-binding protein